MEMQSETPPKKHVAANTTAAVSEIKMTDELREGLVRAAKANGHSLVVEIERRLRQPLLTVSQIPEPPHGMKTSGSPLT